ncbi:MAG: energy transducer TonB [Campylobacterota bacterium]|nr:energy transducer TonB [Campylobacterota bacterium]
MPSEKKDEQICLKLQCITPAHKHIEDKAVLKKIPPKPVKPKVQKPKVEKVVKKIVPKPLSVPVVKEEVKPKEEPEEVYIEPIKEDIVEHEEVTEIVVEEEVQQSEESTHRLSQEEKAIEQTQEYMDEHIKQIVNLLRENLYYPRSARKRGIVGEVVVKFTLSKDATVSLVEVISSKSEILSRAAIKTIEDLSGEFPKPNEELVLRVPINYELKR